MSQTAAQLKRALEEAREYVSKIGKPQPHFRDQDVGGRLHGLEVQTQIHHQANSGDTNYWDDKRFDVALSKVVRQRFKELAAEALELMEQEYKTARIAEKDALLSALAEIEALEGERVAVGG